MPWKLRLHRAVAAATTIVILVANMQISPTCRRYVKGGGATVIINLAQRIADLMFSARPCRPGLKGLHGSRKAGKGTRSMHVDQEVFGTVLVSLPGPIRPQVRVPGAGQRALPFLQERPRPFFSRQPVPYRTVPEHQIFPEAMIVTAGSKGGRPTFALGNAAEGYLSADARKQNNESASRKRPNMRSTNRSRLIVCMTDNKEQGEKSGEFSPWLIVQKIAYYQKFSWHLPPPILLATRLRRMRTCVIGMV